MSKPVKATVADLGWMQGDWSGTMGEDGKTQEVWSMMPAGTLIGMFQWVKGEQAYLYEFLIMEPRDEGVVMLLRHFNPGSVAWEEKDAPFVFTLVELFSQKAVFWRQTDTYDSWIGYERVSEMQLNAYVETLKNGQRNRTDFVYHRQS